MGHWKTTLYALIEPLMIRVVSIIAASSGSAAKA